MNTQLFNFNGIDIPILVDEHNSPLFVAKHICDILGYQNSRDAVTKHVDEEDKGVANCDTAGGKQNLSVINESGLYSLIIRSNKPEAKVFKKWITSEVLPSIRKNGAYLTDSKIEDVLNNPDLLIGLATQLKKEREEKALLQKKLSNQAIKIDFIDRVLDTDSLLDIGQCAKILRLSYGRNGLFKKLREEGIFFNKRNEPKQNFIERGYFELKEKLIQGKNGKDFISVKVLVTQRGLGYLSTKFNAQLQPKKSIKIS